MVAVLVAQLMAAAALWGAAELGATAGADGTGTATGTALRAVALLAVAGVAGTIASGGLIRRVIGGLLALAGVLAGVIGAGAGFPAALLAVLGAVLLVAAGGVLAVRGPLLPRMGARFDAAENKASESSRTPKDPDRRMWDELDSGEDPTAR